MPEQVFPELLVETYGPVQVFQKLSGQYVARCTASGCGWKFVLWDRRALFTAAGNHEVSYH